MIPPQIIVLVGTIILGILVFIFLSFTINRMARRQKQVAVSTERKRKILYKLIK